MDRPKITALRFGMCCWTIELAGKTGPKPLLPDVAQFMDMPTCHQSSREWQMALYWDTIAGRPVRINTYSKEVKVIPNNGRSDKKCIQ